MTNAVTLASLANSGYLRNRIINGAMQIDQRNAGAAVTPSNGNYTLDRWGTWVSQASKLTIQRNAGSVTPPEGFTNYLGVTSSSAYSVVASDYFGVWQGIEGFNIADLAWGTSSAKTITVSFWVRSSLTGTFGGMIQNAAGNRGYTYSYSINSANTWEYKTVTITGDTTGTWTTDNTRGLQLYFNLAAGSSNTGAAGSWGSSFYQAPTGAVSIVGTNGATFYITGVQLEVGTQATPFEWRQFGTELILCQRYFEKSYNLDVAIGGQTTIGAPRQRVVATDFWWSVAFKVPKRADPTCVTYSNRVTNASGYIYQVDGTGSPADRVTSVSSQGQTGFQMYSGTIGSNQALIEWQWTASAEL